LTKHTENKITSSY